MKNIKVKYTVIPEEIKEAVNGIFYMNWEESMESTATEVSLIHQGPEEFILKAGNREIYFDFATQFYGNTLIKSEGIFQGKGKVLLRSEHTGEAEQSTKLGVLLNKDECVVTGYKDNLLFVQKDSRLYGVTAFLEKDSEGNSLVTNGLVFENKVLVAHPEYEVKDGEIVPLEYPI